MKRIHYLFFTLACLLFLSAAASAQTPVAYYAFSGSAKDGSSFANHGAVNGASLTQDRFGWPNSALEFDGLQGGVTAPNAAQLNSPFATISFWVKVNALPAQGEVYLLSFGGWQERWKISLPSHGKPVFTTHPGFCCSDMDSGTPLSTGVWTHVAMVHDGSRNIIYFNGAKVNEKNVAGALDVTGYPLGIGYDPIDKANYFNGALDEVALFDQALSDAEIAALYAAQSTEPTVAQGRVASYGFDGNGFDDTDFGNHADVLTAATTTDRFGFGHAALLCDGTSSEVTASNAAQLNSGTTTVSFWVKVNSLPANGEAFLLSYGGWQERWKISLPSHGKPVFTTHAGGACCSDMDSGTPLTIGTWTHVTMVHDGSKDLIYFNGVKVNEKNAPGALDKTRYPLGIGYDPIDNGGFFDGALDDVQIYNRALSDAEIAALYAAQNPAPVVPGNLVADYPASGNADDATAYNNHAAVLGAQLTKDRFGKSNRAYAFNGAGQTLTVRNGVLEAGGVPVDYRYSR